MQIIHLRRSWSRLVCWRSRSRSRLRIKSERLGLEVSKVVVSGWRVSGASLGVSLLWVLHSIFEFSLNFLTIRWNWCSQTDFSEDWLAHPVKTYTSTSLHIIIIIYFVLINYWMMQLWWLLTLHAGDQCASALDTPKYVFSFVQFQPLLIVLWLGYVTFTAVFGFIYIVLWHFAACTSVRKLLTITQLKFSSGLILIHKLWRATVSMI